jgi:acetolactate synthase I/II/III large subunit
MIICHPLVWEAGSLNGAESVLGTLAASGVEVCFTNPGTTEMHLVAALDRVPGIRGVLGLFEGVVTGAADGYGRIARKPAATLLHLGPGLADGLANLHNARMARTPVVNIVGEYATHHRLRQPFPLDIRQLADAVSGWTRDGARSQDLAADAAEAVALATGPPGCVATLLLPADLAWSDAAAPAPAREHGTPRPASADAVRAAAKALSSGLPAALILGTGAAREPGLLAASRIARVTGARLYLSTFPAVIDRGAGLPAPERLGYPADAMRRQLAGIRHLVLADTHEPVAFFAVPGADEPVVPEGTVVHQLAAPAEDAVGALSQLADAVDAAGVPAARQEPARPPRPTGPLTPQAFAAAVGALLPEGAVVADESLTCGFGVPAATRGAPRHEWLCGTGLALGQGLPAATGAAIAAPGRKVLCLVADGSAMYTIQALWTQAREGLDVTTVVCNNQSYGILRQDLAQVTAGRTPGPASSGLLELSPPALDFRRLAQAMGVPATRAESADELVTQLERGLAEPGPALVEAIFARR